MTATTEYLNQPHNRSRRQVLQDRLANSQADTWIAVVDLDDLRLYADRKSLVNDLADGEIRDALMVLRINDGTCVDVSEDLAQDALNECLDNVWCLTEGWPDIPEFIDYWLPGCQAVVADAMQERDYT
jgi:hypothetical protein